MLKQKLRSEPPGLLPRDIPNNQLPSHKSRLSAYSAFPNTGVARRASSRLDEIKKKKKKHTMIRIKNSVGPIWGRRSGETLLHGTHLTISFSTRRPVLVPGNLNPPSSHTSTICEHIASTTCRHVKSVFPNPPGVGRSTLDLVGATAGRDPESRG